MRKPTPSLDGTALCYFHAQRYTPSAILWGIALVVEVAHSDRPSAPGDYVDVRCAARPTSIVRCSWSHHFTPVLPASLTRQQVNPLGATQMALGAP